MVGIIVSMPAKIKISKKEVNELRKPKEWSSKPIRIIRGKE